MHFNVCLELKFAFEVGYSELFKVYLHLYFIYVENIF